MPEISARVAAPGYESARVLLTPRWPDHPDVQSASLVALRRDTDLPPLGAVLLEVSNPVLEHKLPWALLSWTRRRGSDKETGSVLAGDAGGCRLQLPAGEYTLALKAGNGWPWWQAEVGGIDVTVHEHEETRRDVVLPGGITRLILQEPTGVRLDYATLTLTRLYELDGKSLRRTVGSIDTRALQKDSSLRGLRELIDPISDSGVTSLFLAPGRYELAAIRPGYAESAAQVSVTHGDISDATIILSPRD